MPGDRFCPERHWRRACGAGQARNQWLETRVGNGDERSETVCRDVAETGLSEYTATIKWRRDDQDFLADNYSRGHVWEFDGGVSVPASASPQIVPLPKSVAENVDPEEAFVASLSSCHMLFFLSIAGKKGYVVDEYTACAFFPIALMRAACSPRM